MNIYAIFSYPTNGRDFDQEEACKALIPGEKYQLGSRRCLFLTEQAPLCSIPVNFNTNQF